MPPVSISRACATTRIVAENVDASELLRDEIDHCCDVVFIRDVGLYRQASAPQALNLVGDRLEFFPLRELLARKIVSLSTNIHDSNIGALARETQRNCFSDTLFPTRARDDRKTIFQSHRERSGHGLNNCS